MPWRRHRQMLNGFEFSRSSRVAGSGCVVRTEFAKRFEALAALKSKVKSGGFFIGLGAGLCVGQYSEDVLRFRSA